MPLNFDVNLVLTDVKHPHAVNTHNCDIEIEEMMKRAFDTIDTEGTGLLTPSQVYMSLLLLLTSFSQWSCTILGNTNETI